MIITKGIEIRLYPNKKQANMINKNIGASRVAYNSMLYRKIKHYEETKENLKIKPTDLYDEFPWMKDVDSRAITSAYMDLNSAYNNFFNSIKKSTKQTSKFPKFKKKSHSGSYRNTSMPNNSERLFRGDKIFIPMLKLVSYKNYSFDLLKIKKIYNLTIKRSNTNKYFCSICCDYEIDEYEHTGECIGLDLGVKDLIITSNGQKFDNKKFSYKSEKKIKHLQRSLSKKKKGSKNSEKARLKLAIAHEKLSNKRKNYLHQLTTKLVKDNDIICIEDLNIKGMLKKHCQAKSIADCSFSMIRNLLDYKCKWYNRKLVVIDRWFPSSQTCNYCGYKYNPEHYNNVKWNQNIRQWICHECGTYLDRDINAAKNILDKGLQDLDNLLYYNTVGTTEIKACGEDSSVSVMKHRSSMKQENHKSSVCD